MSFPMLPQEVNYPTDISYTYMGQTLTYTLLNEKYCITKPGKYYSSDNIIPGNNVSGNLIIPSEVVDGNKIYKVSAIGECSFSGCNNLTSVVIDDAVTTIGAYAFQGCTEMTSLTISESVTTIGAYSFQYCSSLSSVTIPNSVIKILDFAFNGCNKMTSLTIGESVTEIGMYAFGGCRSLTSVNIPNSVIYLRYGAFLGCLYLETVTIGKSVKIIGNRAFENCQSLKTIYLPNSVEEIGGEAFYECFALNSITIPESVTFIGELAFAFCQKLKEIIVDENNPNYSSIDGVLFNKDQTTLIQYPIGKGGEYDIPDSVTKIESCAFASSWQYNFKNDLTSVTIPSSVTHFGVNVFLGCLLTSVYYDATEPITANVNVFDSNAYRNATLYVPEVAIEKCTEIDPWKNFATIKSDGLSGIEEIDADIDMTLPLDVYTTSGIKVANSTDNLTPGIYIVRQGNNVKKISIK